MNLIGKDFYELLSVERDATARQIRRAYRGLAKKWHPDHNRSPEADMRFQEITRAYQALTNPSSRSYYDQHGEAGLTIRPMEFNRQTTDSILGLLMGRMG